MANIKRFADIDGEAIELRGYTTSMSHKEFAEKFPGVKGFRYDSFGMQVAYGPDNRILPVTRKVEFKANPSRHECDDRCVYAKGKTMRCECACGGKNHGVAA